MQMDYKMPRPEDVAAIEFRARQMRAEVTAEMFAGLKKVIRSLFNGSDKATGGTARA